MERHAYTIYKPNPDTDPCAEPYLYVKTVYDREEAKALCTLENGWYASVALQQSRVGADDLGSYGYWETLTSGTPEMEELHSKEPIESFLFSVR